MLRFEWSLSPCALSIPFTLDVFFRPGRPRCPCCFPDLAPPPFCPRHGRLPLFLRSGLFENITALYGCRGWRCPTQRAPPDLPFFLKLSWTTSVSAQIRLFLRRLAATFPLPPQKARQAALSFPSLAPVRNVELGMGRITLAASCSLSLVLLHSLVQASS